MEPSSGSPGAAPEDEAMPPISGGKSSRAWTENTITMHTHTHTHIDA